MSRFVFLVDSPESGWTREREEREREGERGLDLLRAQRVNEVVFGGGQRKEKRLGFNETLLFSVSLAILPIRERETHSNSQKKKRRGPVVGCVT